MENLVKIKLGIIGISEGNGHPYSWSAIFNGYDSKEMSKCPFPAIPEYLSKHKFPDDAINDGIVTHIWTQNKEESILIAKAAKIPNVVNYLEEMIGQVDAILLARDDSENHKKFIKPFLDAGLPIFIDKPFALTLREASELFSLQQYDWQIFTCSALRYSKELQLSLEDKQMLGEIKWVEAKVPKSWSKYSIHVIDPICQFLDLDRANIISSTINKTDEISQITLKVSPGILINLISFGNLKSEIDIHIKGTLGEKKLIFSDSFNAFKSALFDFINTIKNKKRYISIKETFDVVNIIELGINEK